MITRTVLAGALTLITLSGAAMAARAGHQHESASSSSSGSTASDYYCGSGGSLDMGSMQCAPLNTHKTYFKQDILQQRLLQNNAYSNRHSRSWTDVFQNRY